jgi:peptidyl-prolyl cis-trans isomerase SurA
MFLRFVLLTTAALPAVFAADTPNVKVVEEIAAKVNGDIITRGELDERTKKLAEFLRTQGLSGAKLSEAVKQQSADALREQIDGLLLYQKGKDLNIDINADVNRRLAEMQVESKISDTDKFHDWVRAQTGMTFEEFRDGLTKEMMTQRVISQEIGGRMTISEPELRQYYEEHKNEYVRKEQIFLSQILVSTENKTPEQAAAAEKKAKDLVERARKGEKFSELARSNSDDPETARNGGELPPYPRGMLQKQIEDVVFKEKKGYVTDPIKVPQGFVILRVEERYEEGQASFEDVRNQVADAVARPRVEPRVRDYLTQLRRAAFLEIREGYIDSGAASGKDTRWQDVATIKPQTTTKEEVAARQRKHLFWVVPAGYANKPLQEADTPRKPKPTPKPADPSRPEQVPAPAAVPVRP